MKGAGMATLERLRRVDAAEMRFRLVCELRKNSGRLRHAVTSPGWHRRRLAARLASPAGDDGLIGRSRRALNRDDWGAAHRDLAAHFATRSPRFPLDPGTLPQLTREVARRFPDSRTHAITRAERMFEGRYDILGYRDVRFGTPPSWHRDPVHGRQPPFTFWSVVPYLDPKYGDHKVIWEINRHQHWLALARAHQLTGDRRYYEAFVAQLEDWMAANPPLQGINWASMLELALRVLSWIWALHFFAPAAVDDPPDAIPWSVDLLLGIDRQLTHIEHNLSRYFSPNTHLSGEALAIYVGGSALPELASGARRAAVGRDVLLQEIDRQINADGGHAELSAHYHRYSTDFYLLATLTARLCGDRAAPALEEAARRQAAYLRAIADDSGRLPLLGDDDGGQLFPIGGRNPTDCRDTLCSAAAILQDPALGAGSTPEETLWFCGTPVQERSYATPPGSAPLPASGYYVSRSSGGDHLIFDAGRHGYLNGGHAHADALSIVLTTAGRPFLVDAGTATYTMDPAVRDRFRSTAMHNTVMIDGRSQSEPRGPFHWTSHADARCLVWQSEPDFDFMEAVHNGYLPKAHARAVFSLHGIGWIVLDHLLGPPNASATADILWHVHPDWESASPADGLSFRHRDGTVRALACSTGLSVLGPETGGLDCYSPAYGVIERGLCLRTRVTASLPGTIGTFITATAAAGLPLLEQVRVTELPGPQWHASAFRLSWCGWTAIILASVERSPEKAGGSAPGAWWGCEEARTDGRAAFVQLSGPEILGSALIRGSRVELAHAGLRRA
jgi:hypothetical protein